MRTSRVLAIAALLAILLTSSGCICGAVQIAVGSESVNQSVTDNSINLSSDWVWAIAAGVIFILVGAWVSRGLSDGPRE